MIMLTEQTGLIAQLPGNHVPHFALLLQAS